MTEVKVFIWCTDFILNYIQPPALTLLTADDFSLVWKGILHDPSSCKYQRASVQWLTHTHAGTRPTLRSRTSAPSFPCFPSSHLVVVSSAQRSKQSRLIIQKIKLCLFLSLLSYLSFDWWMTICFKPSRDVIPCRRCRRAWTLTLGDSLCLKEEKKKKCTAFNRNCAQIQWLHSTAPFS